MIMTNCGAALLSVLKAGCWNLSLCSVHALMMYHVILTQTFQWLKVDCQVLYL